MVKSQDVISVEGDNWIANYKGDTIIIPTGAYKLTEIIKLMKDIEAKRGLYLKLNTSA